MDDRYFHGILGCEAVVCGRRLSNLTPWHVTQLEAIGSPVMGNGQINANDMLVFLAVSQTTWPKRADNLRPRLRDVWYAIRMKNKKLFMRNISIVKHWMEAQLAAPRLWQNDQSMSFGGTLSSPPMLSIVTTMISKFNITRAEAWNMRISEARWYDTCRAELEGADVKVAYDNEQEQITDINSMEESEIVAFAKGQLDRGEFKKWHAARRKNRK